MKRDQRCHLSYLLRLWQVQEEGKNVWRASLQRPGADRRLGFATLEQLFGFLRDETDDWLDTRVNQKGRE